jgi:hypothetical protein
METRNVRNLEALLSAAISATLLAACLVGAGFVATAASVGLPTAPKGEGVMAFVEVIATVTQVDQKTREVTVETEDRKEHSFVAGADVKNLVQVKPGDVITATYSEAFVYKVKKGGASVDAKTAVAGDSAEPGMKPAAAVARQTTVTVLFTAIDSKVPTVTFKGPAGNSRTIKVLHSEELEGVKVGSTFVVTCTEALAIKVS